MSKKEHHYSLAMRWTGNRGEGTKSYQSYSRNHVYQAKGKPEIAGSSDPSFRGDPTRYNPEELLVATLSSCHMLWYLHLCAVNGIIVEHYEDHPEGTMVETENGSGRFREVVLRPTVEISAGDISKAKDLHHKAHEMCFIANSVNFTVECRPEITLLTKDH